MWFQKHFTEKGLYTPNHLKVKQLKQLLDNRNIYQN